MRDPDPGDYSGPRAAGIWRKLCAWAVAAATIGASPAISAAPQPAFYSRSPVSGDPYGSSPAATSDDRYAVKLEGVRHEISVAQRLLRMFEGEFLPEFEAYLTTLDAVLSTELTTLSHAERLGSGLRMARVRFEEEASNVKTWARLASCIDMKPVSGRRVPRRFIKACVQKADEPFGDERSNLWVRRAARDFADVDADPSSPAV